MNNIQLDSNLAVDDIPFVATNRFSFRNKLRKNLDRIRRVGGTIVYFNYRLIYSAHERSVKWCALIVYQADRLI